MATIAEKLINQGIDKGKWDVVMNLLRERIPIDTISKCTGFTVDQIKKFKEKMTIMEKSSSLM